MKKIFLLAFIVIVLALLFLNIYSPSYTGYVVNTRYILDNPEQVKEDYNNNIGNIPGFVKNIFGNELIFVVITMNDGATETRYIKTEKGRIAYINDSVDDQSTLSLWADEATIDEITSSEDQITAFSEALVSDKITYKTNSIFEKAKIGSAKLAFNIWSWFT